MTKQASKEKKAIKKIDKAVGKAVDKGVSDVTIERTVQSASAKAKGALADDDEDSIIGLNKRPMLSDSKKSSIKPSAGKR